MKAHKIGLPTFEASVSCGAYCQGGSVNMQPTTYPEFTDADEVWVKGEDAAKLAAENAALRENANLAARLAEAERSIDTLLGMIRHQRDVLRECLPYLNESMAGRRPGRSADDIRAAVKALTADSASEEGEK